MAAGRLKQKLAIEMIKRVKIDLSKASEVLRQAKAL
jgi:hypothetical protein